MLQIGLCSSIGLSGRQEKGIISSVLTHSRTDELEDFLGTALVHIFPYSSVSRLG